MRIAFAALALALNGCAGHPVSSVAIESDFRSGVRLSLSFGGTHGAQSPVYSRPTYLTKDGALRLEAHASTITRLKADGWMEVPRPEPVHGEPRWASGKWVFDSVNPDK